VQSYIKIVAVLFPQNIHRPKVRSQTEKSPKGKKDKKPKGQKDKKPKGQKESRKSKNPAQKNKPRSGQASGQHPCLETLGCFILWKMVFTCLLRIQEQIGWANAACLPKTAWFKTVS
jgi:hypothetical protein